MRVPGVECLSHQAGSSASAGEMYLLGHTDPKFTMRVYQHVLDLGGANSEQLELVLGCTADEAFWLLSGREPRTLARQDARRAAPRR
jgi:hypothetical protein